MKATIKEPKSAINAQAHRKENYFIEEFSAIVHDGKEFKTPVTLRTYGKKFGAANYACLWVNGKNVNCSGSGKAGGYGYHRTSAATQEAIEKAGIELSEPIDGRGDRAMEDAVRAIAVALGFKEKQIYIHKANG